jgi:hypothetical protein
VDFCFYFPDSLLIFCGHDSKNSLLAVACVKMCLYCAMCVLTDFFLLRMQTALLFAQCMNAKLPRQEGIPPEVKSWSEFCGGKMM